MDGMKTLLMSSLSKYGPTLVLLLATVTIPLVMGIREYVAATKAQASVPPPAMAATTPQHGPVVELSHVVGLLDQLQTRVNTPPPLPEPPRPVELFPTALQPVPDPMIEAINRIERNHQQVMQQLIERDKKMSDQLTQFLNSTIQTGGAVDRSGNTKEQLADIYQDANVPQLPDAMVKGLASNPGARAMIHPDHGQPVIAVTEWGVTNYGGGKQLNLLRHKGKVYGQTVIHGSQAVQQKSQQQAAPPKPEPFRLSLGNN